MVEISEAEGLETRRFPMGGAVSVLGLAVALVIAVKGLPLVAEAMAGRRIEAAVREQDGVKLGQVVSGAAGLAELGRVLRRLPTREVVALGNRTMAEAASGERGAQVLAAIAEVVEARDQVLERWARVRERRKAQDELGKAVEPGVAGIER
jgi:hypothetical protein